VLLLVLIKLINLIYLLLLLGFGNVTFIGFVYRVYFWNIGDL